MRNCDARHPNAQWVDTFCKLQQPNHGQLGISAQMKVEEIARLLNLERLVRHPDISMPRIDRASADRS
jgi:hypothetical protein